MAGFWPTGLDLEDTASPLQILKSAQREWADQSGGLLDLVIQEAESAESNPMLVVHAKHWPSNRTVTLFSVLHRPGAPYPAKIQPQDYGIPDIFKKSYYKPSIIEMAEQAIATARPSLKGQGNLAAAPPGLTGQLITNKWVCDTPSEFRSKLTEVFNLSAIKAEILGLVSGDVASTGANNDAVASAADAR